MLKEHAPKPMRSAVGAVLVSLLLAGGGYTAWAAQPANANEDVAASDALYYAVNLRLTADGESSDLKMIARSGRQFSFKKDGKHVWSGEFTADEWQAKGQPAVMLAAILSKDGKQVASPKLGLLLGQPGSIEMKDDDGSPSFRLEATVTVPTAAERKMLDEALQKEPKAAPAPAAGASSAHVDIATKNTNPPLYPVEAAQKGIDGRVMLIVDVAADGSVEKLSIEKSEPAGVFDRAVLDAASKWRFEPALENGKPVAGRIRVPVDFRADTPAQTPQGNG